MWSNNLIKYTILLIGIIFLALLLVFRESILIYIHQYAHPFWEEALLTIKVVFSFFIIVLFSYMAKILSTYMGQNNEADFTDYE